MKFYKTMKNWQNSDFTETPCVLIFDNQNMIVNFYSIFIFGNQLISLKL